MTEPSSPSRARMRSCRTRDSCPPSSPRPPSVHNRTACAATFRGAGQDAIAVACSSRLHRDGRERARRRELEPKDTRRNSMARESLQRLEGGGVICRGLGARGQGQLEGRPDVERRSLGRRHGGVTLFGQVAQQSVGLGDHVVSLILASFHVCHSRPPMARLASAALSELNFTHAGHGIGSPCSSSYASHGCPSSALHSGGSITRSIPDSSAALRSSSARSARVADEKTGQMYSTRSVHQVAARFGCTSVHSVTLPSMRSRKYPMGSGWPVTR